MTSSAGRICAKSAAVRGGFSGSLTRRLGIPSLLSRVRFPQADHPRHGAAIRDDRDVEASVHQIRIELGKADPQRPLLIAERWAEACVAGNAVYGGGDPEGATRRLIEAAR